jgi:putative FmdB family regulatory protein
MPTYEYACDACNKSFEVEQRITEAPIKKCPKCGKMKARRMIAGGNFLLKGSGWYADGYSGKSNSSAPAAKSDATSSSTTSSSTTSSSTTSSSSSD